MISERAFEHSPSFFFTNRHYVQWSVNFYGLQWQLFFSSIGGLLVADNLQNMCCIFQGLKLYYLLIFFITVIASKKLCYILGCCSNTAL